MREIKFKFLMEDGEVTESYYLKELIDLDSYISVESEYSSKIKQELQYTGLKDKNGIEIYEGDIIEYDFNKFNYRIEFLNAEFIARRFYENIENLYPGEFDYGKECKVIGNIYENPELLN